MAQTSVTTSAVRLDSPSVRPGAVVIKNRGTSSVYLGSDSSVTSANGYELAVGEAVGLDLNKAASGVWAISGTGSNRVDTLEVGT